MRFIDAAYSSHIHSVHPFAKVMGSLTCLLVTLVFSSPLVSGTALCLSGALSIRWGGFLPRDYVYWMRSPLLFIVLTSFAIAIVPTFPREALWGVSVGSGFYGVTERSLFMALQLGLKALACVGCFYFLLLHMPFSQIVDSLRRVRVPESVLALVTLMYRYIFVLMDEVEKIKTAQRVRLGMTDPKTRLRCASYALGALFLRTMNRCDAIHNSLQSRSFEGVFFRGSPIDRLRPLKKNKECAMALFFPFFLVAVGLWERYSR